MATLTKIQSDSPKTQPDSGFIDIVALQESRYPQNPPQSRRRTPTRRFYKIDFSYYKDGSYTATLIVELPDTDYRTVTKAIGKESRLIGYIPQSFNEVSAPLNHRSSLTRTQKGITETFRIY